MRTNADTVATMYARRTLVPIFLIGLLPYISTIKLPPIPSFWAEWAATILFIVWLWLLPRGDSAPGAGGDVKTLTIRVPVATLGFFGLALVILLQTWLRPPVFRGVPLLSAAACVLAGLTCVAGARVRASGEASRLLQVWSWAVLIALVLNLVAATAEYFGLHLYIYQLGWRTPPVRAEGLLGQSNQLAILSAMACVAANYLWIRRRLPATVLPLVHAASALLIVAAASRAGAIMWLLGFGFMIIALRDTDRKLAGWRLAGLGVLIFFVVQLAWTQFSSTVPSSARLLRSGDTARIELLRDSWLLIERHFWTGVGYGQFMTARWNELSGSMVESNANHAHNLIAELFVELGAPAALLVLVPLAIAAWRCLTALRGPKVPPEQFLVVTTTITLLGYAMLEYPLWYTFFLLPFALLIGMLDQKDMQIRVSRLPATMRATGYGLTLAFCAVLAADYRRTEDLYSDLELQQRENQGTPIRISLPETARVASLTAFDGYAELMYSRALVLDGLFADYKVDVARRALQAMVHPESIARLAAAEVVAGHPEEARQLMDKTRRDPALEASSKDILSKLGKVHPDIGAFARGLSPPNGPASSAR